MIDLQAYNAGDALRCVCGQLVQRQHTQVAENADKGTLEIVATCENCGSVFILVVAPDYAEATAATTRIGGSL